MDNNYLLLLIWDSFTITMATFSNRDPPFFGLLKNKNNYYLVYINLIISWR